MGGLLLALGGAQLCAAALLDGWWRALGWGGAAFTTSGLAYAAGAPWLLGKRASGHIRTVALVALWPYFLLTWIRWVLEWGILRENAWDEVVPGLFLGRWPGGVELPEGVGLVADVTAELPAARIVRSREYACLPTLDTTAPEPRAFAALARRVASSPAPVYVHCALGHGRSATLVAAVLLLRGRASGVPEALGLLRAARPRVRLEACQRRLLESFALDLARRPWAAGE
jgi:hypothetical protein